MPVKVQCPKCDNVSPAPDAFVGRKVKCKQCQNQFVAVPMESTQVRAKPASTDAITGKGSVSGVKVSLASGEAKASTVITVVARRVGPDGQDIGPAPARSSPAWMVAAVLALLLPIAGAFGYMYLKRGSIAGGAEQTGGTYGTIEVGSKGVKCVYFDIYPHKTLGYEFGFDNLIEESTDTNIVEGMDKGGRFDPKRLDESVAAVRKYYDLLTKQGLPPEKIFIVGSSGVAAAVAARPELADAVQRAVGKPMGFVSVEEELPYQIDGVVLKDDLTKALFLDIGSGKTRGGYRIGMAGMIKKVEGLGVKGFRERVTANLRGRPFATAAAEMAEKELYGPLHKQVEDNPGLRSTDKVYLVGGIVWVMASYLHPEVRQPYVTLRVQDIAEFAQKVRDNPRCLETFTAPSGLSDKDRQKLENEIQRMRENFRAEELLAGAQILKALAEELEFARKQELTFYRYGHIAWMLEYVAEKSGFKK